MKADLAKDLLSRLGVSSEILETDVDALVWMAAYKYDQYEMFAPGTRFLEHLYNWLKQLRPEDRVAAIKFLRHHLIFISQREMQDLARILYYDVIVPEILSVILRKEALRPLQFGVAFAKHFPSYLRRCLFIGLSDGAKIDFFRRHNIELSQEQVLPYYRTSANEYVRRLQDDVHDQGATFWGVFLIDDFTGSGYTLVHEEYDPDTQQRSIRGALQRVYDYHQAIIDAADAVYLCHYISTKHAQDHVNRLAARMPGYRGKLRVFAGLTLFRELSITPDSVDELQASAAAMCDRYYDPAFEDVNTRAGGGIKFGYGSQGLPLVLYSNTPNNSIYLLWLDSLSGPGMQGFKSLFRRINRHRPK